MRNLKSDLGIPSGATIGLKMDVLPCGFYFMIASAFQDAKFIDVAEKIKRIRSVKSDFEIGLTREAAKMLDAGISSVPDYLEEGMKEVELICRMESVMRSMGRQGSLRFRRFNGIVPLGHCHVRPGSGIPKLPAFANRRERHISYLSSGCWVQQDQAE